MKRVFQIITIALVAILVVMSTYPGLIASTIFSLIGFITLLPLLGLWFLFVGIAAVRDIFLRRSIKATTSLYVAVFSVLAFGLVVLRVPLRIGFAVSRPAFDRFLRTTDIPAERMRDGQPVSRWFGIYYVDRWAHDSRGGIYFRTGTGADMIDQMSYGFVLQPNPKGTPFGAAHYFYPRLFGQWHTFYVSDDYY